MPTTPYSKTNLPSEEPTSVIADITTADVETHYNKSLRAIKELWSCINGDDAGDDVNGVALQSYLGNGIVDRIENIELYGQVKSSTILQLGYAIGGATDRAIRFILATTSSYSELFYDATNTLFRLRNQAGTLLRLKVATPTETDDATTKSYVDSAASTAQSNAIAQIHRFKGAMLGPHVQWTSVSSVTIKSGTNMRDDSDTVDIVFTSDQVVSIAASGENGLQTGLTEANSTRYYLWYAQKTDGTKCGFLSTSSTSPTLPSGYTYKRLEPVSFYNDSSGNLIAQTAYGDRCFPKVLYNVYFPSYDESAGPTNVYLNTTTPTSFTDVSLASYVPPNSTIAILAASYYGGSSVSKARFRKNGESHEGIVLTGTNAGGSPKEDIFEIETDSSQVIEHKMSISDYSRLSVMGYYVNGYTNGL